MLAAGWAREDITPQGPVPLAGYGHWSDRLSTEVRDPVFVRALALDAGGRPVVLIAYDLLLVSEPLHQALRDALPDADVLVHATHTHSGPGGYVTGWLSQKVLGRRRPGMLEAFAAAGERVARAALADRRPAVVASAQGELPGHNGNRRDPGGPVDEQLTVLRLTRDQDRLLLVSYSAHPVIMGERDHHRLSADFPGEVLKRIEAAGFFGVFVQGALGGVDVLFPRDKSVTAEANLEQMAAPLAARALELEAQAQAGTEVVAFARREWTPGAPDARPWYDSERLAHALGWPLRALLNGLYRLEGRKPVRVQGLRVGDFALLGTPADLGVTIALAGKAHAREAGIPHPVVASQCDGYAGYLHLPSEYARPPADPDGPDGEGAALKMGRYENGLAIHGRASGARVLQAVCEVADELARA